MNTFKFFKVYIFVLFFFFGINAGVAFAHQPRIVNHTETIVDAPEISKAYYAELSGEPHVYTISSESPFKLYVNILIPDLVNHKKDVSFAVIKNEDTENPIYVFSDLNYDWKKMYEFFGNDDYLQGPEYEAEVESGQYEVRVWSTNNDSKYSLAIGKKEFFDLPAIYESTIAIPKIKSNFFEKSGIDTILSPFVLISYGLLILVLIVLYFVIKKVIKKFKNKKLTQ